MTPLPTSTPANVDVSDLDTDISRCVSVGFIKPP